MTAVAHILHAWGGGSEKHVLDLANLLPATSYIIKPYNAQNVLVYTIDGKLNQMVNNNNLLTVLQNLNVEIIHVHQLVGHAVDYVSIAQTIGARLYVTLHDYFYLCPQFHLITSSKEYCGLPKNQQVCDNCISKGSVVPTTGSIDSWREKFVQFLVHANKVIAPSIDTFNRFREWLPNLKYVVAPHDSMYRNLELVEHSTDGNINVVLLGNLSVIKGANVISKLLEEIRDRRLPIKISLVGTSETKITEDEYFTQTGRYNNKDLGNIVKDINPSVILFTSICPETYSFTLSFALTTELPIIAPNLGSFIERLANRPYTKLYSTPKEILDTLLNLDKLDKELIEIDYSFVDFNFYQHHYFYE